METSTSIVHLENRLIKNVKRFSKWCKKNNITCYRVYDADLPEYNIAIDIYDRFLHIQEYQAPPTISPQKAQNRLDEAISVACRILKREKYYLKVRKKQKGKQQYSKLVNKGSFFNILEGGLNFLVNLEEYLDTGLFLDHREIRARVKALTKGKSFLNLFCYTGTASVYAAHGGACNTTSVDLSATYLDWAEENFRLNNLYNASQNLVQADCCQWLQNNTTKFDIIFLDPPTFSNSKRMNNTFDVIRDHPFVIHNAMKSLTRNGTMIFSTNSRKFKLEDQLLSDYDFRDITKQTMPLDFQNNSEIHKCWEVYHKNRKF